MIAYITALALALSSMCSEITTMPEIPNYIQEEYCDMWVLSNNGLVYVSDEDRELIARCVMSEAGGESEECQEAVATVILNRYMSPRYPDKLSEIIVPGQFSLQDNGEITTEVYLSVSRALVNYNTGMQCIPYNCYYFRADQYHDFGIPYTHIDNTYFSLSEEATD